MLQRCATKVDMEKVQRILSGY